MMIDATVAPKVGFISPFGTTVCNVNHINALLKLSALDYAGTLNVAGQQALSRAAFGQRLLAWWGINTQGRLQEAQAAEMTDTIPLDLRLTLTKAEHLLEMSFAGVDEVFARQRG